MNADFSTASVPSVWAAFVGNIDRYEGVADPKAIASNAVLEEVLVGVAKTTATSPQAWYCNKQVVLDKAYDVFTRPSYVTEYGLQDLYRELYESTSGFAKAQGGVLFAARLTDIAVDGELKDGFLLVKYGSGRIGIKGNDAATMKMEQVATTDDIDYTALLLDVEDDQGPLVLISDFRSKKSETRTMWRDAFLRLEPAHDSYFYTCNLIEAVKAAIDAVPGKIEKMNLRYAVSNFLKDEEEFEFQYFCSTVGLDEANLGDMITLQGGNVPQNFTISPNAVKASATALKTTIKLDRNFSISANCRPGLVERGFDEEKGKNYYKLYFDAEKD